MRDRWSGTIGFILAAAGSAVGLGNLWKFPYITLENGGGLFVIIYLICIGVVGLPIMMSELSMGWLSEKDPVGAFKALGGKSTPFRFVGLLGVASGFVILSYYSVVAGWSIQYTLNAVDDKFSAVPVEQVAELAEKNHDFIKQKTFEKTLAEAMTVSTQMRLKVDATGPEDKSIDDNLLKDPKLLAEKLKKRGRLHYWQETFYREQSQKEGFAAWQAETLRPMYATDLFVNFVGNGPLTTMWHFAFMIIVLFIVMGGISKGVEKASMILMPTLFVLMTILMFNSLSIDKHGETFKFMTVGEPTEFKWDSILEALGHAFFTLSLGMGAMMTYGSYLKRESNVVANALMVVGMDTLVALMACLMIFPIIFVYGMDPGKGSAGILFTALPLELMRLPFGPFLNVIFYLLVFFAALTSAISLLEVVVTYFSDEKGFPRVKSTLIAGGLIFAVGIPSALSGSVFDFADSLATNVMLPLGGLLTALFVGYKMDMSKIKELFDKFNYPKWMYIAFRLTLRYVTPVLISVIFISTLAKMF